MYIEYQDITLHTQQSTNISGATMICQRGIQKLNWRDTRGLCPLISDRKDVPLRNSLKDMPKRSKYNHILKNIITIFIPIKTTKELNHIVNNL